MRRIGNERAGNQLLNLPVKGATELIEGTMAVLGADGYAVPASKATGLTAAGRVEGYCDNLLGEDGDATVTVKRGTFVWANDGTIEATDLLKPCYIKDATTVTLTADGASLAGIILEVAEDGVTVDMTQGVINITTTTPGVGG